MLKANLEIVCLWSNIFKFSEELPIIVQQKYGIKVNASKFFLLWSLYTNYPEGTIDKKWLFRNRYGTIHNSIFMVISFTSLSTF